MTSYPQEVSQDGFEHVVLGSDQGTPYTVSMYDLDRNIIVIIAKSYTKRLGILCSLRRYSRVRKKDYPVVGILYCSEVVLIEGRLKAPSITPLLTPLQYCHRCFTA